MYHLIPFAAGVVVGAVVLRLLRSDKPREGLDKAGSSLRGAAVSSLEAIEGASARARKRLTRTQAEQPTEEAEETESIASAETEATGQPASRPRRRTRKPPTVATDDMEEEANP